jgi:hypothetical protein
LPTRFRIYSFRGALGRVPSRWTLAIQWFSRAVITTSPISTCRRRNLMRWRIVTYVVIKSLRFTRIAFCSTPYPTSNAGPLRADCPCFHG